MVIFNLLLIFTAKCYLKIVTTLQVILIPDDDPGDNEMSGQVIFHGLHRLSKYFGFLASVFRSHVVYLVMKFTVSHYFFFSLYLCIKDYISVHIPKDKC